MKQMYPNISRSVGCSNSLAWNCKSEFDVPAIQLLLCVADYLRFCTRASVSVPSTAQIHEQFMNKGDYVVVECLNPFDNHEPIRVDSRKLARNISNR